jgi:hypothetical protein
MTKDVLIVDNTAVEIFNYVRQISPEALPYITEGQLDRLLFTAKYIINNYPTSSKILDIGSFPYFIPGYLSLKGFGNISTIDVDRPDYFHPNPQWKIHSCKSDIEEEQWPFDDGEIGGALMLYCFLKYLSICTSDLIMFFERLGDCLNLEVL